MATFGAGCFWHVEEAFRKVAGVTGTAVGYMGGRLHRPTYKDVCTDKTGHAEVIQVEFDPAKVSFADLLGVFWKIHDPTQVNRQGVDVGTQYRSVVFYHDAEQKAAAEAGVVAEQARRGPGRTVVTQVVPAGRFYRAEEYHQRYLQRRGRVSCGI
jgi:peptide-methionine (S)-S-oxide reductase